MPIKRTTSAETAARFRRLYSSHRPDAPLVSPRASANLLDEFILRHSGDRIPKRSAAILADVRDDYGSVDDRRFWSRLASLRKRGLIERTLDGYRRLVEVTYAAESMEVPCE